jgi:CubicO group peptidase (beta-lactamase class C family)
VRQVVRDHLAAGLDVGFAFCVYQRGRPVVDLWGGHADARRTTAWTDTSLVPLTSISKTILATLILRLAEAGEIDLEAPIAHYWPEFGQSGKDRLTIAAAMSHQGGIPVFEPPITLSDEFAWTPIVSRLSEMHPLWPPGTAHGYHAVVLGFLLSELLRRVTGKSARRLTREHITDVLGLDLHTTLDDPEAARLVQIIPPEGSDTPAHELDPRLAGYANGFRDHRSLLHRATFGSTAMTFDDMNNPAYYRTHRPVAYGTATAVARMYAALVSKVDGCRILNPASMELARTVRAEGRDRVFQVPVRWGSGFMLPSGPLWPDFGRAAFGHIGSTGALAFADPEAQLAFAFLPNKMKSIYEIPDRRAQALTAAVYRALGSQGRPQENGGASRPDHRNEERPCPTS